MQKNSENIEENILSIIKMYHNASNINEKQESISLLFKEFTTSFNSISIILNTILSSQITYSNSLNIINEQIILNLLIKCLRV